MFFVCFEERETYISVYHSFLNLLFLRIIWMNILSLAYISNAARARLDHLHMIVCYNFDRWANCINIRSTLNFWFFRTPFLFVCWYTHWVIDWTTFRWTESDVLQIHWVQNQMLHLIVPKERRHSHRSFFFHSIAPFSFVTSFNW